MNARSSGVAQDGDSILESQWEASASQGKAIRKTGTAHWQRKLAKRWNRWGKQYDAMQTRERWLLTAGCAAVLLMVLDQTWVTPSWKAWQTLRIERQQAQDTLHTLSADLDVLRQKNQAAEQQWRTELAALQQRLQKLHAEGKTQDLVPPSEMLPLLEQLLDEHQGLKVRALQSLGRTTLGEGSPTIYRHGVSLTLEGNYSDLMGYLHSLEESPQRLLWNSLTLKVEHYPTVQMTLQLHTLSTEATWVEL